MAENEQGEGEEKKSSKLIIIIAVVLLLVGGGAGYYFMASGDSESEASEELVEEPESDEETEAANEEFYYDMSQSLIVNFPKGAEASLIQVTVSLLVRGGETVEAVKKHEPMIRNNLLMIISAKGPANLKTREGKEALREAMLEEVGKVMERMTRKNKVKDVFFTTFVMQ